MSNYKGHRNYGFVCSIVLLLILAVLHFEGTHKMNFHTFLIVPLVSTYFALFPDIDVKSKVSKWTYRAILIVLCVLFYYDKYMIANILAILSVLPQIGNHRGFTHTYIAAFGIPLSIATLLYYNGVEQILIFEFTIAAIIGYISHLIADNIMPKLAWSKK